MSYEEDYRTPYKAKCLCGKGYLKYYEITKSNDWGQTKEFNTNIEIHCSECSEKYYCKCIYGDYYMIPKEMTPPTVNRLPRKYELSEREQFVGEKSKETISDMIWDFKTHTYMKQLTNQEAMFFAQRWASWSRKKSLKPMLAWLESVLSDYDSLKESYDKKIVHVNRHLEEQNKYFEWELDATDKRRKIHFEIDYVEQKMEQDKSRAEAEAHKYDPFQATVIYDNSYKKSLSGNVWDTLYIQQCTDEEHLKLVKPPYGNARVIISKMYSCTCYICKSRYEIDSSEFKIDYDDEVGYFPRVACNKCHQTSSFEAKTMEILNSLGITYAREISLPELNGNKGVPLRFDFALYKEKDLNGKPKYDLFIELQGPHHYKPGYYDSYGTFIPMENDADSKSHYATQKEYDDRKREYCEEKCLTLRYIKYTYSNDYDRLEKMLIKYLKESGYNYFDKGTPLF